MQELDLIPSLPERLAVLHVVADARVEILDGVVVDLGDDNATP